MLQNSGPICQKSDEHKKTNMKIVVNSIYYFIYKAVWYLLPFSLFIYIIPWEVSKHDR